MKTEIEDINQIDESKSVIHVVWKDKSVYLLYDNEDACPAFVEGAFQKVDLGIASKWAEANEVYEFCFDESYTNPLDYNKVLNNWNLLSDIARFKKMYFEGNSDKYTKLYDYLFRCSTCKYEMPQQIDIPRQYLSKIQKVFRKQSRQLAFLFE